MADTPGTDIPGTCHLVDCPGKGTVDEHVRKPIGCPDDFAPYGAGLVLTTVFEGVAVPRTMLVRVDSFLSALLAGRVVSHAALQPAHLDEARILAEAFRRYAATPELHQAVAR